MNIHLGVCVYVGVRLYVHICLCFHMCRRMCVVCMDIYSYIRIFSYVYVTEWLPVGKIAAHSVYEVFSWYKYLIVSLFFPPRFSKWESFFLIAPFPDRCLLVPFSAPSYSKPSPLPTAPLLSLKRAIIAQLWRRFPCTTRLIGN